MATFLQLCQDVARESGTISGPGLPMSVTGQSGRLLKVVMWTAEAWRQIQNARDNWRWMRREFEGATTAGAARYTPASWNLDDFASWVRDQRDYLPVSIYRQSAGVSDEGTIREVPWETWRAAYGRGAQTENRPTCYAISPSGEFCLGAIPNDAYVVRGEYYKAAQTLAADGDVPECPARFHNIIVWKAVLLLSEHDEAAFNVGTSRVKFLEYMEALERDQLPRVRIGGGPLA